MVITVIFLLTYFSPVSYFYTLCKRQKNLWFSDLFMVYRNATLDLNGLIFNYDFKANIGAVNFPTQICPEHISH